MAPLQFSEIIEGFRKAGVQAGDTVLIHSALRPFGCVEGGAATVARALYSALGETDGTLVAPAFCFAHEIQDNPIIDPENDASEMGAISEAVRRMDGALRSLAYRHSFSALGRHAQTITNVDPFMLPLVKGGKLKIGKKISQGHNCQGSFVVVISLCQFKSSNILFLIINKNPMMSIRNILRMRKPHDTIITHIPPGSVYARFA